MASIQEFEKVLDQSDTSVASFHSKSPLQRVQHFLHSSPAAVALIVLVLSIAVFGLILGGKFFSAFTLTLILQQVAIVGIVGAAQTLVILTKGIDLSVGAIMVLSSVVMGQFAFRYGLPPELAVICGLGVGAFCGFINGVLVARMKLPPFIVTLAGMFMARGLASILTQDSIPIDHDVYRAISGLYYRLPGGGRLSAIGLLMLFVFLVGGIIAHKTRFGSYVYALGGNPTSAALMGVPVARTTIGIYALASFLGGLAGIVYSLYTSSGYPLAAVGMELDAIAAVVIGGTLLTGGYGFIFGTLIGVMLQGLVQTYIVFDGTLSSWWTKIAIGLLLFMFILLQKLVFSAQGRGPRLKRAPA